MRWLKRTRDVVTGSGSTLAEPPEELARDEGELRLAIERLTATCREHPDRDTERRLLRLHHLLGARLLADPPADPAFPSPADQRLPSTPGLPEFRAGDLTPELLRAGILRDGCVLVRGLVAHEEADAFAALIDDAFAHRERVDAGETAGDGRYEPFVPQPGFAATERGWIKEGGGLLAADSPPLAFGMLELFRGAGVPELVAGYLGEPPLISVEKTTLRRADPAVGGAWHQDGAFMGEVRALNLWLALSRCGDEAPGLDLVPRRLEGLVSTQTDDAVLDFQVSQRQAEEAAGGGGIIRPVFHPGDALFFDELFLHQTGADPAMSRPRFAIESWFFGASGFPREYAPLAV